MTEDQDIIDEVIFSEAKAMMQQKFQRIIGYYLEDTQSYIETIIQGVSSRDASLIIPAAHTIKSSSRQLGAIKLSEKSALLEEIARDYLREPNDFTGIEILSADLPSLFETTRQQMEKQI